tara:strand:- start:209 stop:967 length:759 start_codon:yes stop_codon:yes gene_type:complete
MSEQQTPAKATKRLNWRRFWPIAIVVAGFVAYFALGLDRFVTLDALREHRSELIDFVAANAVVASLLFVCVYAGATALSLPGGLVLSLTGGFLFGTWLGGVLAAIGATIGASIIFLIAKTSLGDAMMERAGPMIKKMEAGFQRDAVSYMLILRLVPLFPFWLVNIVPAFLSVSFRTYFVTTAVGILPAAFIYTGVGNGLGHLFEIGADPNLGVIFELQFLCPLLGLAVLALIPVGYNRWRGRSGELVKNANG